MRHRKNTAKLGMKSQHKRATLANLVCSLIKHKRIRTTVPRAKVARRLADQMVTLGKRAAGTEDKALKVYLRRLAAARLNVHGPASGVRFDKEARKRWRKNEDVVRILFEEIAPAFKDRNGGYTRIVRVGNRRGDAAEVAILEWTNSVIAPSSPAPSEEKDKKEEKPAEEKAAKPKKAKKSKDEAKS